MTIRTITIPGKINARTILELSREFSVPDCGTCIVDFRSVNWCEPFGLLYLARILGKAFADRPSGMKVQALSRDNDFRGYAAHMGFFKYLGFQRGNEPGQARGSNTYVPINRWSISDIHRQAGGLAYGEYVDIKAKAICEVMLQTDKGTVFDYIQYALREILRNAIEHSEGSEVIFCAQYWPARREVEIGILDNGVGLRKSLLKNPRLPIENDTDAVQTALLPGISGTTVHREADGTWQNSGFGLYVTSALCGHNGQFRLVSGKAGVHLTPDGRQKFAARFKGTGVQMRMSVPSDNQAKNLLSEISERGIKQAKSLEGKAVIRPSLASLMLSSDFPDR